MKEEDINPVDDEEGEQGRAAGSETDCKENAAMHKQSHPPFYPGDALPSKQLFLQYNNVIVFL